MVRGARWAWTQTTTDDVDNLGNVRLSVAHGRLHDASDAGYVPVAYGEQIRQVSEPVLLNSGGQWIWRTRRGYVNGAPGAPPLGETLNEYDARTGDLLYTQQPANRLGAAYDFTGGAQTLLLTDQVLEASSRFDAWGSATASCGGADLRLGAAACLRYSEVSYDAAYGQLPASERVAVDRSGAGFCSLVSGFCTLSTTAVWDRGFGVLTQATDPNGQTTVVGYDGLGRLSYVKPPVFAGCPMGVPAQRFEYELAFGGQPVSYVHAIQNEGNAACTADELLDTYTVVDGLGRTRASVVRAEANEWVKAGFAHMAKRGAAYQSCNPVALRDTSNTFNLSWAASHEGMSAVCTEQFADAFGRPVQSLERDLVVVAQVAYHALSVDTSDALDIAGPMPFAGTPSTERKDGHGRTIESLLRNRQPGQSQSTVAYYRMVTSYRADNAVVSVTRAETATAAPLTESQVAAAAVPGPSGRLRMLTRTFTYDSAGRRLGTTDPDSDSRNGSRPASARTWRYLYNRVGDLAAVRDPRGCGHDFYYDNAGRLLAEDYIGCGEAQALGDVPDETLPSGAIGLGVMATTPPVDVRYFFDESPWYYSTMSGPSVSPAPPAV
ncbi:MAG: hypothetical protein GXP55_12280, partial [Deltaproteobacteria bacterium]|nr:hypothetical protein [Deltaproteobacteria bacterium]